MTGNRDAAGRAREHLRVALHQHLQDLPVLPTAVARLLSLDQTKDAHFDDVVAIIEHGRTMR
ncbi:MAG TPA: hypothetical protein VF395_02885 [Polyangiaceae bacterium]